MSSGRIKLSPDELRDSAIKYENGSEEIAQILKSLESEQNTIKENWEGDAFDSFDQQFTELAPKITEFSELLHDIREQLDRVADIIEQTDADIASQIRG
jgi:WXG100 family type VII secretion target